MKTLAERGTLRWHVGAIVLAVGSMAEISAQGGKTEKSPARSPADAARAGKVLFLSNCARCHGQEGKGNGPDSDHAADLTDDLRTELNTEGVPVELGRLRACRRVADDERGHVVVLRRLVREGAHRFE